MKTFLEAVAKSGRQGAIASRTATTVFLKQPWIACATGLCLAALPASARECRHTRTELRCVEYIDNYDGDTITVNVPEVHVLLGSHISVRVYGIDTPEIRSADPCEKTMALAAKAAVREIVQDARKIDLLQVQRDKYFRILAEVMADGQSVAQVLISQGLAVPYDGGTKKDIDWCAGGIGPLDASP